MRQVLLIAAGLLLAGPGLAQRPTPPTSPVGPVPAGGVLRVKPVAGPPEPTRGILYIPQFAPPGVQVPGGPPATNTPTLITPNPFGPTVLGTLR